MLSRHHTAVHFLLSNIFSALRFACFMHPLRLAFVAPALLLAPAASPAPEPTDPLRFFEGRTETQGTVKILMRKPYKSRGVGVGTIEPDGSLTLVQQVHDEGKPMKQRRWKVRRAGPGRFTATMSEASGPVVIDKVGGQYRFRFKLQGNLAAEQMMIPLPGGRAARNTMKVKRLGVVVATTEGTIRKVS